MSLTIAFIIAILKPMRIIATRTIESFQSIFRLFFSLSKIWNSIRTIESEFTNLIIKRTISSLCIFVRHDEPIEAKKNTFVEA